MAVIFTDGFETGDLSAWDTTTGTPQVLATAGLNMIGAWCFLAGSGENIGEVITGSTEHWVSLYVRPTVADTYIITFYDGSDKVGRIRIESNKFTAYVDTVKVATGTLTVNTSTTYYLRIYFKVADSGGKIQLRVDEDENLDIDYSGDTKPGATVEIDNIKIDSDTYVDSVIVDDAGFFFVDADPLEAEVGVLGDSILGVVVDASPLIISLSVHSTFTLYPPAPYPAGVDYTFDCKAEEVSLDLSITVTGDWFNKSIVADPIDIIITQHGIFPGGVLVVSSPLEIIISFKSLDVVSSGGLGGWSNRVRWSEIGHLDFTVGRDNVAGDRPMDWRGWIYDIRKLGRGVIVYGENGVSILTPSSNAYGLDTVYRVGLKSNQAVIGDDTVHFFIDNKGCLYSLKDSLKRLDYSEYFSPMGNIVMSLDSENEIIYICDGSSGYVYSIRDESLGAGPINLTGISAQNGTIYAVAPATIVTPVFEICTDIYDMSTRDPKTISSVEVGTDLSKFLQLAIDFRISNKDSFTTLQWHLVNPNGVAYINCYGVEFRFRLKALSYEQFEIDYLIINGLINDYSFTKHGEL